MYQYQQSHWGMERQRNLQDMHYKKLLQFESKFFLECKAHIWSSSQRKLGFSLTMMTEVGLFFLVQQTMLLKEFLK